MDYFSGNAFKKGISLVNEYTQLLTVFQSHFSNHFNLANVSST
jgi:hypothetical protein